MNYNPESEQQNARPFAGANTGRREEGCRESEGGRGESQTGAGCPGRRDPRSHEQRGHGHGLGQGVEHEPLAFVSDPERLKVRRKTRNLSSLLNTRVSSTLDTSPQKVRVPDGNPEPSKATTTQPKDM